MFATHMISSAFLEIYDLNIENLGFSYHRSSTGKYEIKVSLNCMALEYLLSLKRSELPT